MTAQIERTTAEITDRIDVLDAERHQIVARMAEGAEEIRALHLRANDPRNEAWLKEWRELKRRYEAGEAEKRALLMAL